MWHAHLARVYGRDDVARASCACSRPGRCGTRILRVFTAGTMWHAHLARVHGRDDVARASCACSRPGRCGTRILRVFTAGTMWHAHLARVHGRDDVARASCAYSRPGRCGTRIFARVHGRAGRATLSGWDANWRGCWFDARERGRSKRTSRATSPLQLSVTMRRPGSAPVPAGSPGAAPDGRQT